jgi:hypothetical protein
MADSGKHPHDSGRARAARFRDRSQLEFEDFLIDDFLEGARDPRDDAIDQVPIRFESRKLSTHLSDSAIASAMLDAGVFEENLHDDSIAIGGDLDFDLFALLSAAEQRTVANLTVGDAQVVTSAKEETCATTPAPSPPVIRTGREHPASMAASAADSVQGFSMRRFAQGFAVGAVAGAAALALLRMII